MNSSFKFTCSLNRERILWDFSSSLERQHQPCYLVIGHVSTGLGFTSTVTWGWGMWELFRHALRASSLVVYKGKTEKKMRWAQTWRCLQMKLTGEDTKAIPKKGVYSSNFGLCFVFFFHLKSFGCKWCLLSPKANLRTRPKAVLHRSLVTAWKLILEKSWSGRIW